MDTLPDKDRAGRVLLRTYGQLWKPERRIYAIEGRRLPVPGGLPIVVPVYFVLYLAVVVFVLRLPVLGDALGIVPAPIRFVMLPLAGAIASWRARPDGRSLPSWFATVGASLLRPSHTLGGRRARRGLQNRPHRVEFAPDLTGPPVRGVLRGPCAIRSRVPLEARDGRLAIARSRTGGRRSMRLLAGARLEVRY